MSTYAKQDQISSELAVLHAELRSRQFEPGWNRAGPPPMWSSPRTPFTQAQWRYADARQALMRAEHLVDLEFAERRNLIMVNPTEGNLYPTSRALVLAYQLVLPGERARTHRHTPHAGRLVLEADEGAYTVVNGVQVPMLPGDVLLTPSWSWHGHGNSGTKPAVWIDFLDVPLVHLLDPMFFEPHPDGWAEATIETRDTPILFPYGETNARLDAAEPDPSGCFGRRIELGSPALPRIPAASSVSHSSMASAATSASMTDSGSAPAASWASARCTSVSCAIRRIQKPAGVGPVNDQTRSLPASRTAPTIRAAPACSHAHCSARSSGSLPSGTSRNGMNASDLVRVISAAHRCALPTCVTS